MLPLNPSGLQGPPFGAFWGRGLCGPRDGYNGVPWSSPFSSCSTGLEHTASQLRAGGGPGAGDLLIPSIPAGKGALPRLGLTAMLAQALTPGQPHREQPILQVGPKDNTQALSPPELHLSNHSLKPKERPSSLSQTAASIN